MDSSTKSGLLYMWCGMSECLNPREQWKRRSLPLPTPSSLVQGLEDQGLSRPFREVPPAAVCSAVHPHLLGWRPCRGLMRREVWSRSFPCTSNYSRSSCWQGSRLKGCWQGGLLLPVPQSVSLLMRLLLAHWLMGPFGLSSRCLPACRSSLAFRAVLRCSP